MTLNRDFLGIWIPSEIWLKDDIDISEKCLLAEIESLWGSKTGCFASNKYLCDFLWCDLRNLQYKLAKLDKLWLIDKETTTENKRLLFVKGCNPLHPPMQSIAPPPCNPLHPPYIEENKDIEKSFFYEEKEKIDFENNEIISLEELREYIKLWVAKEEIPWRDTETCLSDWWLLCEMKGYKIKKRSAHMAFMKYLRGWDKKKMEEEKRNYEEKIRKSNFKAVDDIIQERERVENTRMVEQAKAYIEQNPSKLAEIEEIAYKRALGIARGNENTAMSLKKLLIKKVAYEFSIS